MAIKILVVDDHEPFRQAVRSLLEAESDLIVVAEAVDGESAVELAARLVPDVVVMDIGLPGTNGIDAAREIMAARSQSAVVVLSIHTERRVVDAAFAAGALGYVAKNTASRDLIPAVRSVDAQDKFVSRELAQPLLPEA